MQRAKKKDPKKMSLHSTRVVDRKRALTDLVASLAAQGDTAAASLEARLAAVLEEGEEMPDVRHLFRLLERLVERAGDDLQVHFLESDHDRQEGTFDSIATLQGSEDLLVEIQFR